jgi:peptide chain release factor 2
MKRLGLIRARVDRWEAFRQRASDLAELASMAEDPALSADLERELQELIAEVDKASLEAQLSGPYDERDAVLAISAGVGGTDAADWAQMLVRMYVRWAERHGFKAEIVETTPGEEAGIRSATLTVEGPYAYGYLKTERGTHRLVRISPFDFQKRRQTSFALVDPTPQVQDDAEIEIRPKSSRSIRTARPARAGRTSTKRRQRYASRISRAASSCRARTNAHSCRTVRPPCAS